jgi:hypothetical protein
MAEAGIEIGPIDGLAGPQTVIALEQWQDRLRGQSPRAIEVIHQPTIFPRQKDVRVFYGEPGKHQVKLELPFPMRLAWDTNTVIRRFAIHEKAHDSAARAFARIRDHYGEAARRDLGLDLFGGCLNVRKMRGGRDRARMATPEHAAFLDIWEEEGWISLGRERNYDWMHVQAARL